MNTTIPSPLAMTGKRRIVGTRVEGNTQRGKRGKQVTAKVDDGQPAWVSRTPLSKQDDLPLFKHVALDAKGEVIEDWSQTYLGTRLIVTKDKAGTRSRYADLYWDEFEYTVIARWSHKPEDVTIGYAEDKKVPGVDAALKIAARRDLPLASRSNLLES